MRRGVHECAERDAHRCVVSDVALGRKRSDHFCRHGEGGVQARAFDVRAISVIG